MSEKVHRVRRMLSPNLRVPAGVVIAFTILAVLLLGSVGLALRPASSEVFSPFSKTSLLDYTSRSSEEFLPLSNRFLANALGIQTLVEGPVLQRARAQTSTGSSRRQRVVAEHVFTNDDFENAWHIPSVPFTARTTTNGASRQLGEPTQCSPSGGTAWYRYVATEDAGMIANTFGSSFVTALGVFSGAGINDLRSMGCDTDAQGNSQVGFKARSGEVYYFQVTGPTGGGSLIFNLEPLGITSRMSISSSGEQGDDDSRTPAITADGRYVAFISRANNMVAGYRRPTCSSAESAFNHVGAACPSIFVRDRLTGKTVPASVSSSGQAANDSSWFPSISADGRHVAFDSMASNLVSGDDNGINDVFVHDLVTGTTSRVSVSSSGKQVTGDSFSFVDYLETGSRKPVLSADGRHVAFYSYAVDLVPGDTNGFPDSFVHDRLTGETKRVSISSAGTQANANSFSTFISADGRFVAFESHASNLVSNDTNGQPDIFLHDLILGKTTRISVSSSGEQGNGGSGNGYRPMLSGDGRYVVFNSDSSNLVENDSNRTTDYFVHDRVTRKTHRVSVSSSGDQASYEAGGETSLTASSAISLDGRVVAFSTWASNLVPDDTNGLYDVFLHDLVTLSTTRVSVSSSGEQGNAQSAVTGLTRYGQQVAFNSDASNLVPGDTNGVRDVFVFERP